MTLKKTISLIYFAFVFIDGAFSQPVSDTCYKSFFKFYETQSPFVLQFKDICRTSDGGYAVVGYKLGRPAIVKLNSKGDTTWSRFLNGPVWSYKVLQTKDGNFVVATFSMYDGSSLIKFNNNGLVLWSKLYDSPGTGDMQVTDVQETNDSGFVMIFNSDYGFPPLYTNIVRVDSNGNPIWKNSLGNMGYSSPVLRCLLVEGNDVFVASEYYPQSWRSRSHVAKLDLANGSIIWQKAFQSDPSVNTFFDPHLVKINDTLIISSTGSYQGSGSDNRADVIVLNANSGNLLNTYEFVNPILSYNVNYYRIYGLGPCHFAKTTDNKLVIAQLVYYNPGPSGVITPTTEKALNITKFTIGGNVIWSKSYPNIQKHDIWSVKSDGDEILTCGRRYVAYPNTTDGAFIIRFDHEGNITGPQPQPAEICYSKSIVPQIQPLALTEYSLSILTLFTSENNPDIIVTDYSPQIEFSNINTLEFCSVTDTLCRRFTLSGPDSVCLFSTNTFKATRSNGCTNTVTWGFDSNFISVLSKTDTSITVKFLKEGVTSLLPEMQSSCSKVQGNKVVFIKKAASTLNLGADTSFCFPASFNLNAKTGFKSYLWSNGLTDSVITITSPGTYYVDVLDVCNNVFRDSIIITDSPSTPVEIGPARNKCNNDTLHLTASSGFINYTWGPAYEINDLHSQSVIVSPDNDTIYYVKAEKDPGCFAYDSVKVTIHYSTQISLGSDTSICLGNSVLIDAGSSFQNYLWSNGATTQKINVTTSGIYDVIVKNSYGCLSKDTISIQVLPIPIFSLGNDTSICSGHEIKYNFNLSGASYSWHDGLTSAIYEISTSGQYWLAVTQNGCVLADSIIVTVKSAPVVALGNDTTLCEGDAKQLIATNTNAVYKWQDGSSSDRYSVSKSGNYYVAVDIDGCINSDSIDIVYLKKPEFDLGHDTMLCNGQKMVLRPILNTNGNYLWQDGSTMQSFNVTDTGLYSLSVYNQCGTTTNSVLISRGICELYMPNVFTPNNDHLNDVLKVKYPFTVRKFSMSVYNRYGQLVFETSDMSKGWDGKLNGKEQPSGNYIYIISMIDVHSREKVVKGNVLLIR